MGFPPDGIFLCILPGKVDRASSKSHHPPKHIDVLRICWRCSFCSRNSWRPNPKVTLSEVSWHDSPVSCSEPLYTRPFDQPQYCYKQKKSSTFSVLAFSLFQKFWCYFWATEILTGSQPRLQGIITRYICMVS